MNRPKALKSCLDSVFHSQEIPDEIIVSDDSFDKILTQIVVAKYPKVIYQKGPELGLSSNRNACINKSNNDYIIFIDDDVQVPPDFFTLAREIITDYNSQRIIITGFEIKHDPNQVRKIVPHNIDFWGLQRIYVDPINGKYRAIVINSTIFPRNLFKEICFDEHLRYGSEEIDIACHAVHLGYQIAYQDRLFVNHYPSPVNRDLYQQFIHASRLYATAKAYWKYEKAFFKVLLFMLLAPLQLIGSHIRQKKFKELKNDIYSIILAGNYIYDSFCEKTSSNF